jgi:hypothetical protein
MVRNGRFLSNDPVGFAPSRPGYFNRYAYVGNDPFNAIDPTGMNCVRTDAGGGYTCDYMGFSSEDTKTETSGRGAAVGAVVGAVVGVAVAGTCDTGTVGACVAANPAIVAGGIALGTVTGEAIERAYVQLEGLVAKAIINGPQESQYALVAETTGLFPDVRNGTTTLNAGDVWKYGTSANPADRYSDSALQGLGLRMVVQSTGTKYAVLAQEKMKLIQHAIAHGSLPPGNKIFK